MTGIADCCCARAATGHAAAPPTSLMTRAASNTTPFLGIVTAQIAKLEGPTDVRFGSKADICSAIRHVRFTPESGHVRCN
jgi:hypothetical protein